MMDYAKFSSTSLVLMHAAFLRRSQRMIWQSRAASHQIRDTPEWQDHAKAPEDEMGSRGVLFAKADFEREN